MAKSPAKAQPKKPAAPKAPKSAAAAPVASAAPAADDSAAEPVEANPPAEKAAKGKKGEKGGRGKEHVTHFCYDNEHQDGVHCTLTFEDGATAEGSAPSTGDLAADQAAASAAALNGAA